MEKIHSFLDRNSLLLNSCDDTTLSVDDINICQEYAVRSNVLGTCPPWLKKWISLVLRVVKKE
jgi:hypothetical protein